MNFLRNTNSDKGATRVTHHAKATSAGSIQATGASRGLFRRALAARGASSDAERSGAASSRRLRSVLSVLALAVAAFAITAVPASADTAKVISVTDVSYGSAHLKGEVSIVFSNWQFEYSKNPETEGWTPGPGGFGFSPDEVVERDLTKLKGATKYFVRLTVGSGAISPEPNPEFTTLAADPPTIPGTVGTSSVFSTSATAIATVKRPTKSGDVECRFEYISDAQFEENVTVNSLPGFTGATPVDCAENPIGAVDAEAEKAVSANLSGLSPNTAYHLRLVAENPSPDPVVKDAPVTFTTLPPVAKPVVLATDDATEISYFTAKVSGEVQRPAGADPALDTSCRFEYVTNVDFSATGFDTAGQAPCVEATPETPITSAGPDFPAVSAEVSAELSGLADDTTYHLRLSAENGGGTAGKEAAGTFTTLDAIDPVVDVHPIAPEDVGYTTVHVSGTIDRGTPEREFSYGWQVSTNPDEWSGEPGESICCTAQPGTQESSQDFTGLKPGTKYYVRIVIFEEGFSFSPEPYESFTTKGTSPVPPSAGLDPVSAITGTSAHFSGSVDTNTPSEPLPPDARAYYKTDWTIECTPECKDGSGNVFGGTVEAEDDSKAISVDVKRLQPNTTYEVKLVAHNLSGTVESVQTFKTLVTAPTVKSSPGAPDGKGGYTLEGVVDPNNSPVTGCEFQWGPNAPSYAFSAPCSPAPGDKRAVTVEAHLTGLNPGVTYHSLLVITYGAGIKINGGDQKFVATLNQAEKPCDNDAVRAEGSSLALPECRAYEMVTPSGKEGFSANLFATYNGDTVGFSSKASNLANSGTGRFSLNYYVTARTPSGWETLADLNGPSGSLYSPPTNAVFSVSKPFYSVDLLSSAWAIKLKGNPLHTLLLRGRDGGFTPVGTGSPMGNNGGSDYELALVGASDDLSHIVLGPESLYPTWWGPGVYEFVGTGNGDPRRVDVDNSGSQAAACIIRKTGNGFSDPIVAEGHSISSDGRVIVFRINVGCGEPAPVFGIWARVNSATSFDVSASQCDRSVGDPDGACNAPSDAAYQGEASDGSRIFFTTRQQLLDTDVDQTNDLYACDIPAGTPTPTGKANLCAPLRQVSGATGGTDIVAGPPVPQGTAAAVLPSGDVTVSEDGSTVYFIAKGVLADNEDALGNTAQAGDRNFYAWRADAAHPDGQTSFVARLDDKGAGLQITPDNRYLSFATATPLLDTDTDSAQDVYRYDADSGELTRISTGLTGVGGNGEGFSAGGTSMTDDGQKIVFATAEPLSPVDGNKAADVYLWTPERVSLISTGAVGGGGEAASISASGRDIYFETPGALSPADPDLSVDVYDARVGGGFSFAQSSCSGEGCQAPVVPPPPPPAPEGRASDNPGAGNPKPPKSCPKGKVRRRGKCVKKPSKKHGAKKHHSKKQHKRSGSNAGGGK
jgi:hypothetical protein